MLRETKSAATWEGCHTEKRVEFYGVLGGKVTHGERTGDYRGPRIEKGRLS